MSIPLGDLLKQVAKDGIEAYCDAKVENASFFEALFKKTDDGYEPRDFTLHLLKHNVPLPLANMIEQSSFSLSELDLEFETEATLTTSDKGEIFVDCTLKDGLQKRNSKLKVSMKMRREESTEGIEQVRAYLADRLADDLQTAKRKRKDSE